MVGILGDAIHGADRHALRLIVVTHALGALVGVDFVDFLALVDGSVRALGLTHVTVDAFVGDHQCHGVCSSDYLCKLVEG
jgi:hypothetical protein